MSIQKVDDNRASHQQQVPILHQANCTAKQPACTGLIYLSAGASEHSGLLPGNSTATVFECCNTKHEKRKKKWRASLAVLFAGEGVAGAKRAVLEKIGVLQMVGTGGAFRDERPVMFISGSAVS